jgi:hypothetical protein
MLLDWNDRRVRRPHHFARCDFHLRDHDELVGAFNPGDASTHQLCRPKSGQDDELEDAQLGWTMNHSSFFLATRNLAEHLELERSAMLWVRLGGSE